ncbi:ArnT family glycosyltransferase [Williamsia sterculiae]|uniref:Dolichyl-phosphate-mannose-protein mannosyltransferase n=1 Tax=Williamsia sterculiae TaxID=1344003 RepID=A0A1N7CU96_9NOCA|nr:glycosyltransferase family 39 protein [Williamsia sterculiae]SIR67141.1 Dolichyl-phosphate-mannose-protein mannosyltransferase [Williamsia sterculiae]
MTRLRSPMPIVFVAAWAVYLVAGLYLSVHQQFFVGDSLSRVAAAQSVLFSRDPHAAAIGFVFTPLTALIQLPLTALTPYWPAVTADAVSAAVMSSAFMAGSVVQLAGVARDRRVWGWLAAVVTVLYAVDPMILFYGANGMSEAPFLFFLTWAVRRLIRWVDTDDVHDLVCAAVALGLAYLTRYDSVAAIAAAALLVGSVTWWRGPHTRRLARALLDVTLTASPGTVAFVVWAVTSWLITGDAFAQFTSEYGNAAIISQSGGSGSSTPGVALGFSVVEMLLLAPLLPVLMATIVAQRWRRGRVIPVLPPLAVCGAVLAFQVLSYARGSTFGFLRFYIVVIPLTAVIAMLAVPGHGHLPARRIGRLGAQPRPMRAPRRHHQVATAVLSVVVLAAAIPVTVWGMRSPKYAPQEFALAAVLRPEPSSTDPQHLDELRVDRSFSTERRLAEYLDGLDLSDGTVLTDTVFGFAVVARSTRPRQFVLPSDRDFTEVLNDPVRFGVRYLLTVPPTGRGASDAINLRYPTMYATGAELAVRVLDVPNVGADLPNWRVYRMR